MGIIKELTTEEEYKERGWQAAENFTRERKLTFEKVVFLILNMINESSQNALDRFYEKFGITNTEGIARQQSFSEARQNIKWEAEKCVNSGISFVFRLPKGFNKNIDKASDGDNKITIKLYKKPDTEITLRVLKFVLSSGEEETLITDISNKNIHIGDFKNLYWKRRGIETEFNRLVREPIIGVIQS